MSENDEETLRRLILELRILEGRAGEIQARLNVLNAFHNELQMADNTLEGLTGGEGDLRVLVPLGGGSYVNALIEDPEKVLVGVGAGVSIEKDRKEAIQSLKEQQNQIESARQSLQNQLAQVGQKMSETRDQVNDLYRTLSEGSQNV